MYSIEEIESKFELIIADICNGYSLRKALLKNSVANHTFYKWIEESKEKMQQYARACEERAEYIVDEAMDIVDDTCRDKKTIDIGDGVEIEKVDTEAIQRSKLRFEARQWLVGKLNPKKYGNKIDITSKDEKIETAQINLQIEGTKIELK